MAQELQDLALRSLALTLLNEHQAAVEVIPTLSPVIEDLVRYALNQLAIKPLPNRDEVHRMWWSLSYRWRGLLSTWLPLPLCLGLAAEEHWSNDRNWVAFRSSSNPDLYTFERLTTEHGRYEVPYHPDPDCDPSCISGVKRASFTVGPFLLLSLEPFGQEGIRNRKSIRIDFGITILRSNDLVFDNGRKQAQFRFDVKSLNGNEKFTVNFPLCKLRGCWKPGCICKE